ncbi:hypothetical protein Glove_300g3 [Diversispora epigaea]|uniref:BTB domain-containing protein n=1 Tax=Diversispora epigaea TaxID=1348612 RepID=A0A397HWH7_9GLOM|nr:hypothetical protein Glove_300g3 [Diversispora epigaea]
MTFKFFDKLSQDFSELLNDKKDYDVIIEVGKEGNKKSFTAHSVVLRYRSPYFGNELANVITDENHIKTVIKPNISGQIFKIILKYIYGGIVDIENTDTKTIYELMIIAKELELEELSVKLESYLIDSKASWLRTHFSFVYHSIFDGKEFEDLEKFYNDIIVKHPNLIFESEDLTSLHEAALISILKRDDLKVEEVQIWDYVLKWGIAQIPTLTTNLEECEDIWEKVKPYKKILEEQLWDDMIQHYMFPNKPVKSLILPARNISNFELQLPSKTISTPKLPSKENDRFSTIINKEHFAEISSWIDRKSTTYSFANIPYEFQLILRGSRDDFNPKTFWNKCHGHANTIVVAKVAGTDEIIGGYNPLAWDNSTRGVMETKDSFIFSLKNGNIQDSILSRVIDSTEALFYDDPNVQNMYGPCFGNDEFILRTNVSDFTQDKFCWCNYDTRCEIYYEKPIRTTRELFSIVDYEVFKIIKQILNCTVR